MAKSAKYPIKQPRHQPFLFSVGIKGLDVSGSAHTFQVRENKEAGDPALLNLADAEAGANGISTSVAVLDGLPYTSVQFVSDKASMEAIAQAVPLGSDLTCYYSYKIDGIERLAGEFIVEAQANHA